MAKIPVGFLCASMTGCVERRELSRDRGPVSTGTSIYWRQLAENGALSAIRLMAAGAAVPAPGSGGASGSEGTCCDSCCEAVHVGQVLTRKKRRRA